MPGAASTNSELSRPVFSALPASSNLRSRFRFNTRSNGAEQGSHRAPQDFLFLPNVNRVSLIDNEKYMLAEGSARAPVDTTITYKMYGISFGPQHSSAQWRCVHGCQGRTEIGKGAV